MEKKKYRPITTYLGSEAGAAVLAITVMLLVVVSLLGVMAMTTSNIDMLVTGNTRRLKEFFYVSESGVKIEQNELGTSITSYPVSEPENPDNYGMTIGRDDALNPNSVANDIDLNGNSVADNAFDRFTPTGDYEFVIIYVRDGPAPSGYGINFQRLVYRIESYSDLGESDLHIETLCWKIASS